MSKIALSGPASGTATYTISAPTGATDRTITLPDQTATLITNSSGVLDIGSGQLYKDASGNVGIGTSSPGTKLDVSGNLRFSAANPVIELNNGGAQVYSTVANTLQFASGGGIGTPTERARIDSSGNLLVGTTSGSGKIRMKQSADAHSGAFTIENFGNTNTWSFLIGSDNNLYFGYNATSRGVFNNSTGAYTTISDRSLKKDIAEIQYGLNSVLALRPVSYLMKDQEENESKTLGFIAQEVDEVVPESVSVMRGNLYGMDKEALIPVLVKAIQEQQALITALTARVTALEGTQP